MAKLSCMTTYKKYPKTSAAKTYTFHVEHEYADSDKSIETAGISAVFYNRLDENDGCDMDDSENELKNE